MLMHIYDVQMFMRGLFKRGKDLVSSACWQHSCMARFISRLI
ncbi:hypothetical protein Hdeb2414_s0014g00421541 [Helianthus debilis subsp. tardiflorus]